jgi:Flp pilus assembly protein TadD
VLRLLYNLKIRRRLFGSLVAVAFLLAVVATLGSGVLDKEIRRKLTKALQRKEAEIHELLLQADAKARNGQHPKAIAIYLTALARNPAGQRRHRFFELKQRTRIGLSKSLAEVGKNRQAKEIARSILREEPEYWYAHKHLGEVLTLAGKAEQAAKHYSDALRVNPSDQATLSALTEILAEKGQRKPLIEAYRQYLRAYALGTLKIWLDDVLVFERDIVINGSRQRVRIPHPGDGRLRMTCLFNDQPVGLWLGEIKARSSDPMSEMFLEDHQRGSEDIVRTRIGIPPALEPSAEIRLAGDTKFLELSLAASKPWTEAMTRQLRRAVYGNPR